MLKIGKIDGETALLLQKIQMNGERNHMWVRPKMLGEILPWVQDNPNPNCDGTQASGRKARPIGEISLILKNQ